MQDFWQQWQQGPIGQQFQQAPGISPYAMRGGPGGGGSQPSSLDELLQALTANEQQQGVNRQNLVNREGMAGAATMAFSGLDQIARGISGSGVQDISYPGSPWGGQFQLGENPGLTELMAIVQAANQKGWGF